MKKCNCNAKHPDEFEQRMIHEMAELRAKGWQPVSPPVYNYLLMKYDGASNPSPSIH
jgi:hypothetical protein